jgi:hypothetical protein
MGMLDLVLGCPNMKISKEKVRAFVENLKRYLISVSALLG